MIYLVLADFVVLIHAAFILFALTGGLLVLKWSRCLWIHLPAVTWAAFIEFAGWICPLTPLENWFRRKSGEVGYESDFVEHYILPVIYPDALTGQVQVILGIIVILVNLGIYGWVWRQKGRRLG